MKALWTVVIALTLAVCALAWHVRQLRFVVENYEREFAASAVAVRYVMDRR